MSNKSAAIAATAWMVGGATASLAGLLCLVVALLPDAGDSGFLNDGLVVLGSIAAMALGCLILLESLGMLRAARAQIDAGRMLGSDSELEPGALGGAPTIDASSASPAAWTLPPHALAFAEEMRRISSERSIEQDPPESAAQVFIRHLSEPAA